MTRLKLALLGLVSGTALMVSANANAGGDLAPERPFSWTGFYLGLHAGVAFGDVDSVFSVAPASPWDHDRSGMIGGGQVGYNWQTGNIVLGVEADASWGADVQGDAACPNPAFRCGSEINRLASVRGRVGVTGVTPFGAKSLLYATGGWGWAEINYNAVPITPGGFSNTTSQSGWVAGGGLELAHTSNVSFKIEYLAYVLDGETISAAPLAGNVVIGDQTIHTVRAGLNYRF